MDLVSNGEIQDNCTDSDATNSTNFSVLSSYNSGYCGNAPPWRGGYPLCLHELLNPVDYELATTTFFFFFE